MFFSDLVYLLFFQLTSSQFIRATRVWHSVIHCTPCNFSARQEGAWRQNNRILPYCHIASTSRNWPNDLTPSFLLKRLSCHVAPFHRGDDSDWLNRLNPDAIFLFWVPWAFMGCLWVSTFKVGMLPYQYYSRRKRSSPEGLWKGGFQKKGTSSTSWGAKLDARAYPRQYARRKYHTRHSSKNECHVWVEYHLDIDEHFGRLQVPSLGIRLFFPPDHLTDSISLITIMGLIGEQCSQCAAAADAENGGGLAGSWWRAWARVSFPRWFVNNLNNLLPLRQMTIQGTLGLPLWVDSCWL